MPEACKERIGSAAVCADIVRNGEDADSGILEETIIDNDEFPAIDVKEEAQQQIEEQEACRALTLEQRCDRVEQAILRQSLHREIHYKTLMFCCKRRNLAEIESHIQAYPEFKHATQDPCHLIRAMVCAGGLQEFELDQDGCAITPAMKEGLDEDELDDLVAGWAYEVTDAGKLVVERHAPRARLTELLNSSPERRDAYIQVLQYLEEVPRTYAQVSDVLSQNGALNPLRPEEVGMQPSVFLDKLERAGGIVWDEGWFLTEGGREFLEELDSLN